MKLPSIIIISALSLAACHSATSKQESTNDKSSDIEQKEIAVKDTTPRVIGIGGIFFKSKNPKEINEWYSKNLGLAIEYNNAVFEYRNANNPNDINYLIWSPFKEQTDYFNPSQKDFMINYRVQNIEGLVRNLKNSGATVVDSITTYDYGKFVHILDPEGTKIELWEPIDSVLTKISGKTNK